MTWAQKARANWLHLVDKNTKFFRTSTTIRRKRLGMGMVCGGIVGRVLNRFLCKILNCVSPMLTLAPCQDEMTARVI